MADLSMLEKRKFEELFNMSSGYVLDFTNQSFASLFQTTVGIDIYKEKYSTYGDSKAKRLRSFWEQEPNATVGKVLFELLSFWKYLQDCQGNKSYPPTYEDAISICYRLMGKNSEKKSTNPDEAFLEKKFDGVDFGKLKIESNLIPILTNRFNEAQACIERSSLACIFLCGSILEGMLLGAAVRDPKDFNCAAASPKDSSNRVRPFHEWSLANFIDVAHEIGIISLDVKKFSHSVRDFRNYIHPYQQMSSGFSPDKHTAEICLHVVRAAVASLTRTRGV
jgi:hypothetical protein